MSEPNPPLLWLLDFLAPSFRVLGQQETLKGDMLIASRQIWSLLKEQTVRSALVGPGVVKGRMMIKGHPLDVEFLIGAVIFDPTEMRPGEPIPLLDIITPEVIDPLEQSTHERVEQIIRALMVKKGKVLEPGRLITYRVGNELPRTLVTEERMVSLNISFLSGKDRARFLLGGQKQRIYAPFKEALEYNRFSDPSRVWVLRLDQKNFESFNRPELNEWSVVEMYRGPEEERGKLETLRMLHTEYSEILKYLIGNRDYFVF